MVNAGRILILAKGAWNSTTNYTQLDLVSYNSIAYLARQASVGVNPSTDTQMVYWMPFGSAASIATTSTPGLVMPDGQTITITNTGLIKAVLGLNDVSDVTITSPANGQVLKYNSTTQKWENASLGTAAAKNATDTISSGSTDLIESGAVHSAIQTLTNQVSNKAETSTVTALANDVDDISDEIADMNNILGAKNVLPNNAVTQTINGVTFTVNSDGSITVSGTATAEAWYYVTDYVPIAWSNNSYLFSGRGTASTNINYFVTLYDSSYTFLREYRNNTQGTDTIIAQASDASYIRVDIVVPNGATVSGTFYPMIRPASIKDDTYVPYAPINRNCAEKSDLTSISETGTTASQAISKGQYFYHQGVLKRATSAISSGASITSSNSEEVTSGGLNWVSAHIGVQSLLSKAQAITQSAGSYFWEFSIPKGTWLLFVISEYSAITNIWVHIKNKSSSYSNIMSTHVSSDASTANAVVTSFSDNITACVSSDAAYNNQELRLKVLGVRLS